MSRIYRALNVTTGTDYLVRAHTQAQAIRHVVADQYRAQVAGQETIVEHLAGGGVVMDATREPETADHAGPEPLQWALWHDGDLMLRRGEATVVLTMAEVTRLHAWLEAMRTAVQVGRVA